MQKLLFFITLIYTISVHAQILVVLKPIGNAYTKVSTSPLKLGDKFQFTDLKPLGKNVLLRCMIAGKGVLTLDSLSTNILTQNNSEITNYLLSQLKPMVSTQVLTGRAGNLNSLVDVITYFKQFDSCSLLVIDSAQIPLNVNLLPDKKNDFFYLRYQYNGEAINKKLSFENTSSPETIDLILDSEILKVDQVVVTLPKPLPVQLFLYNSKEKSSSNLISFNLMWLEMKEIAPELCILRSSVEQNQNWKEVAEVYLADYYGCADFKELQYKLNNIECKQ